MMNKSSRTLMMPAVTCTRDIKTAKDKRESSAFKTCSKFFLASDRYLFLKPEVLSGISALDSQKGC